MILNLLHWQVVPTLLQTTFAGHKYAKHSEFLNLFSRIQMQLGAATDTNIINALLDKTLAQTLKIWREIPMLYFFFF